MPAVRRPTAPGDHPAATPQAMPPLSAIDAAPPETSDRPGPALADRSVATESPPAGLAKQPVGVHASTAATPPAEPQPRYRIGAVARMLRMPVATLRVWERRYQVTRPETSASGHRLYSAAEVQRLALLRQLVSLGHAVGALAHLDMAGLHTVAATHARAVAQPVPVPEPVPVPVPLAGSVLGGQALQGAAASPSGVGAGARAASASGAGPGPATPVLPGAHASGLGADRRAPPPAVAPPPTPAVQRPGLLLLGEALTRRLGRPAWQRWLAERWQLLATVPDLAAVDAAAGPDAAPAPGTTPLPCALLASVPTLQAEQVAPLAALVQRWGAGRVLVLYRYAGPGARAALRGAGLAGQVQPADDAGWQQLVQDWLGQAGRALSVPPGGAGHTEPDTPQPRGQGGAGPLDTGGPLPPSAAAHPDNDSLPAVPPRRYSDATLTDLAALSTTIVCECPAHVAELLMALSHFEAYSAECAHRSPTDAAMHQHLQQVAGTARALFERALARLAVHEGLILPEAG